MKIKGLLIDSGKVLNGPITGHWMITPNFFHYVDKRDFYHIPHSRRQKAFKKGMEYIEKIPMMENTEEEYIHFQKHYEIIFNELTELKVSEKSIKEITKDLVYNDKKYRFYSDAVLVIPHLAKKLKLAIVSDAWPSLNNVFAQADFRKHFESFTLSCELGVTKPNPKMFQAALNDLDLEANEVIFIDDSLSNCKGAKKAGIKNTMLMCRSKREYWYRKVTLSQHRVVRDFRDVLKYT
jgi:putative hydrolase of the HAD superfamily